jgi:PAS domain S-box-containing protein
MLLGALNDLGHLRDTPKVAQTILGLMPESGVIVIDPDLRIVLMQGPVYERHGYDAASAVGRDLRDLIPSAAWAELGPHWAAALAGQARTVDIQSVDGEGDYWLHFSPLRTKAGVVGAILVAQDITDRVLGRDELRRRLTQQAAVSTLGSLALGGRQVAELLEDAVRILHDTLASDVIMVLETTADGGISVRASAGEVAPLPPEPSPRLRRSIGEMRAAGRTLLTSDLSTETGFHAPGLEAEGMISLVAAPIGSGPTAFGELVACSRRRAAFTGDDLAFVESVANVLMAAVERERAASAAAAVESRRSEFWQLSHDLLAVFSADGHFVELGGAWEETLGWAPEELVGRSVLELVLSEDRADAPESSNPAMLGAGTVAEVVNRFQAKDGSSRWLLWSVHQGPDGSLYAVAKDITERYEEQELAAHREEQLNDAQRLAGMGSWDTDFASGTHTLSENLREMLAMDSCLSSDDIFLPIVHPEDRARMTTLITMRPEHDVTAEFRVVLPGGRIRALSSFVRPLRDEAGVPTGLRGTVKDVTEERRGEEALRRSEERFRQGFDNAPIAMSLVDPLSMRYVRVNDAFCTLVGRTREALYELTFDAISHPDDLEDIRASMPRLARGEFPQFVTEKRYPRPDGSEVWASVNITPVREPDGSVDVLFGQMVDITERKAREASLKAQLDEIAGLGEIRRAFEEDRFELHAQPIIDLATGETVQRELLIRMRSREGKLIPPGDFLPAAEKHGAIRDIDRWVLSQGADLAARGIDVEINISAASIGDPGLITDIENELERTGADPSRLVFEITETALIEKTEVAVELAERLRKIGCRFALDDFGSGYGGFHYLKHLPMDFLKIDREFVRDLLTSVADQHVIRAVVGLAHGFGLKTIAEGVEDQETLDLLRDLGVDHAQGFLIGRPALLPASAAGAC